MPSLVIDIPVISPAPETEVMLNAAPVPTPEVVYVGTPVVYGNTAGPPETKDDYQWLR